MCLRVAGDVDNAPTGLCAALCWALRFGGILIAGTIQNAAVGDIIKPRGDLRLCLLGDELAGIAEGPPVRLSQGVPQGFRSGGPSAVSFHLNQ